MQLVDPQFLWALLLLPLVWWLSQPPKPQREVLSAHLVQWRLAMRALNRRPPRGSWLRFALLALAIVCATVAAARPFVPGAKGPDKLVVLLDASASMAAAVEPAGPPPMMTTSKLLSGSVTGVGIMLQGVANGSQGRLSDTCARNAKWCYGTY